MCHCGHSFWFGWGWVRLYEGCDYKYVTVRMGSTHQRERNKFGGRGGGLVGLPWEGPGTWQREAQQRGLGRDLPVPPGPKASADASVPGPEAPGLPTALSSQVECRLGSSRHLLSRLPSGNVFPATFSWACLDVATQPPASRERGHCFHRGRPHWGGEKSGTHCGGGSRPGLR